MKNILNEKDRNNIINRIQNLLPDSKKQWGKMNVNQMICHVSDQIKMSIGVIKTKFVGNFILKTLVKRMALLGMPIPKGKVQTVKELNQEKDGTKPTEFEKDKRLLIELIKDFDKSYLIEKKIVHPAFGSMNKSQWGRLAYLHLDYHLKQFSA